MVAKGAALAGLQAALRAMIAATTGDDLGGEPPSDEQIKDVAEEAGISRTTAQAVLETEVTNVCSRGFGIKVLREDADPSSADHANFQVLHVIEPNTPLPIDGTDPDRVMTFGTVNDNQTEVQICVMEQESRELTDDMAGNRQIEEGRFQVTRACPRGAPIHIAIGMESNGTLSSKAIDQDGREMQFTATTVGAVMSDEQLAESANKVEVMRRGRGLRLPFDPKTYLVQILSPYVGAGFFDAEIPDMFERYRLDPGDDDDAAIAARLADVRALWDKRVAHPKYGALIRMLCARHLEAEVILGDPAERGRLATETTEHRRQRARRAAEELASWRGMLDVSVGASGGLNAGRRAQLERRATKLGLDPVLVAHELDALPVAEAPHVLALPRRQRVRRALTELAQQLGAPDRRRIDTPR